MSNGSILEPHGGDSPPPRQGRTISAPVGERTRIGWHPITLALALVLALSLLRAGAAFAMRGLFGSIDFPATLPGALFLLAVFLVGSVGIVGGGLFGLAGVSWDRLGWRKERLLRHIGRGILAAIVIGIVTMAGALVAVKFCGLQPPEMGTATPQFNVLELLMSVCFGFFIASWQEENLFRGYLQPLLIERLGLWPGIIGQAALFSIAHLGWYPSWHFFVFAFAAGLILGWLRGRDGSLVAAFVAHGLVG